MASVGVTILYLAWAVSWGGTFMTTCTMGDSKSLGGALILSPIFYLCAFFILAIMRAGVGTLLFSLPLMALLLWQAAWAVRLFIVTNIHGLSPCNLMMGEHFGTAHGGFIELVYAPYYFLVSIGSLGFIAYSHRRYRRQLRSPVELGAFD